MSEKKPKVAFLVHESLYGGGSRPSFYILAELCRQGFPTVLISNARTSWLGRQIDKLQLPVTCYFTPWIQRAINPIKELGVLLYLIRVFLKERPDVVVACGVKLLGLGCFTAWLCRVPYRFVIVRGQGAAADTRLLKVIYGLERFIAVLGTRYITVCDYNCQEMIDHRICAPSQIKTVRNGTDIAACRSGTQGRFRQSAGLPEDAFVFGMVGRLTHQKRYDLFIMMMSRLCQQNPLVYGVIIGEGEDRAVLQQQIDRTGFSDRIHIVGYWETMADVYADLDVSVLFTFYEGCANALLESTAAGVPLIADAVCGNPEVVHHKQNGFIVAPGDIETAIEYATKLIADPKLRRQMGQHGRTLAEQCFDHHLQVRRLIDVITHPEIFHLDTPVCADEEAASIRKDVYEEIVDAHP